MSQGVAGAGLRPQLQSSKAARSPSLSLALLNSAQVAIIAALLSHSSHMATLLKFPLTHTHTHARLLCCRQAEFMNEFLMLPSHAHSGSSSSRRGKGRQVVEEVKREKRREGRVGSFSFASKIHRRTTAATTSAATMIDVDVDASAASVRCAALLCSALRCVFAAVW